jgi:hypothetical protein
MHLWQIGAGPVAQEQPSRTCGYLALTWEAKYLRIGAPVEGETDRQLQPGGRSSFCTVVKRVYFGTGNTSRLVF